ncbi:MAG: hypothetical protein AAGD25_07715 [Cyanobacteria bacterium P01_F01_bin.150]
MDFIEEMLDKLRELVDKLLDSLLGPDPELEHEPIPVPVNDRYRRR